MKHYLSINDLDNLQQTVAEALQLKKDPFALEHLGRQKTICLLFFNNSLRTRLSTQKAARQLGMDVMVMNFGQEGWQLEYGDGSVMDKGKSEHVREAAQVVSQYADIVAIRAFAQLLHRERDEAEEVLRGFSSFASVPIVNLESSVAHPLQALADAITLAENNTKARPKVVLSWAPHPKALPHAVANSFVRMMHLQDADFVITHPEGYALDPKITKNVPLVHDQEEALKGADFVYVKNWSSYTAYGEVLNQDPNWRMSLDKLKHAKFMHCLPVRRNMVVEDAVLDSGQSLVIQQAHNRTYAAQVVLKRLLEQM
ncbi:acetylornithine carbamoyltransferase [Maribacter sp. 2307ULW6-5]|uniref:acetylornithine carbamoyltransferase n=1 Tax=Maribacter sp. 2307ULW6-5 TaxID=3386275 RepID=UPI0039BC8484